jgi:hypothetical protein
MALVLSSVTGFAASGFPLWAQAISCGVVFLGAIGAIGALAALISSRGTR